MCLDESRLQEIQAVGQSLQYDDANDYCTVGQSGQYGNASFDEQFGQ